MVVSLRRGGVIVKEEFRGHSISGWPVTPMSDPWLTPDAGGTKGMKKPALGGFQFPSWMAMEDYLAEREGFEPSLELTLNSISSAAPSTARPSLQNLATFFTSAREKIYSKQPRQGKKPWW